MYICHQGFHFQEDMMQCHLLTAASELAAAHRCTTGSIVSSLPAIKQLLAHLTCKQVKNPHCYLGMSIANKRSCQVTVLYASDAFKSCKPGVLRLEAAQLPTSSRLCMCQLTTDIPQLLSQHPVSCLT